MRHSANSNISQDKGEMQGEQGGLPQPSTEEAIPACGLAVSESRHTGGFSGQVRNVLSEFLLVIAGHSRWEAGGHSLFLGPNCLLHISAGLSYHRLDTPEDPVTVCRVRYRADLLSRELNDQLAVPGMLSLDLTRINVTQVRIFRSIFQEMLFEQAACREGWEMMLRARLIDLAVRAVRLVRRRSRTDLPAFEPGTDSTERVARYALNLKTRFFHHETINEAAFSVGLRRRQFTDLFRKVTGQTWRQYVLGLRLNHAAGLLAETDRSVVTVAFESGFDDLSYFNHSFKAAYGCSPMTYRSQRQVRLPDRAEVSSPEGRVVESCSGFKFRGIKGWFWTPQQYLEEIPVLASLKMNFLMNCYGSMMISQPKRAICNEWRKPMPRAKKMACGKIIRACRDHDILFCFALHPQFACPRPLDPANHTDVLQFYQHYAWAQSQQVQWFSLCLDGTRWDADGPALAGLAHARLVNALFSRLRAEDKAAQFILLPAVSWGDAANRDQRAYLRTLARQMHPEVYVFWNGDSIRTPRVSRIAAEAFKAAVNHRLLLWDNYPVNDGSPTLHLGPVSGREADLCEVIDGYLSNPMHTQNQMNRIPLATCADYAFDPWNYNPARSIGQAILKLAKTNEQQRVLKDLVEAYPGFIVAGGASGTNPVRGKFSRLIGETDSRAATGNLIQRLEDIHSRLTRLFPGKFQASRATVAEDIHWMKRQAGQRTLDI